MKNYYLKLIILFIFFSFGKIYGQAGFFGDGVGGLVVIDQNGSGNVNSFQWNQNLGVTTSFILKGAIIHVWKGANGNICSGRLYYRVYKNNETPGSFSPAIVLGWNANHSFTTNAVPSNVISGNSGDQRWQTTSQNINLLDFVTSSGTWVLEVYFEATGSSSSSSQCTNTFVNNNGGDNYKIFFDVNLQYRTKESGNWENVNTWQRSFNGSSWVDSNSIPSSKEDNVTVLSNHIVSVDNDAFCKDLTVQSNGEVIVEEANNLTVKGDVINNGSFTLENNANLLQEGTVNNNEGAIVVKRNSSALKRLDYTLWSSPVSGQNLFDFSPETVLTRFYVYNTLTNTYSNSNAFINPEQDDFATAKGYMIRMPDNHPTSPTIWNGEYTGVPHNGNISFTMVDDGEGKRFNLVGNPYPSPISALAFVSGNSNITGTLYFWRKTNNPASPSYCSWSPAGGGTFTSNGEDEVYDLNNIIRTGQGFFVEANGNGTELNFTNAMRVGDTANQFFRYSNQAQSNEAHRFWLNATGEGAFSQMVIGYFTGATNDVDQNIDGRYINDGAIALNSIINDVDYVIQGRALPFDIEDAVPLSFRATTAGSYMIEIDHTDGLFSLEQDIFVEDMQLQVFHNLKETPYTFESEAGVFNDRFRIVYQNGTMNTGDYQLANAVVFVKDKMLYASSGNHNINKITIYDVRGSILKTITGLNVNQAEVNLSDVASQVLLVRLETQDNRVITKKVVR